MPGTAMVGLGICYMSVLFVCCVLLDQGNQGEAVEKMWSVFFVSGLGYCFDGKSGSGFFFSV